MTFVFDPKIFLSLPIEKLLLNTRVTADASSLDDDFILRPLRTNDYDYLALLKQLTVVGEISPEKFKDRCQELISRENTYFIIVLEDINSKKIVGCATLLVELKMIHELSKRGHIEDVVIDNSMRGRGFGKLLVAVLLEIGRSVGCYKISLDCDADKTAFYERNGFKQETISMCVRLDH